VGCKRILISNDYYPALERPNVELVTSPLQRFTPEGIVTEDGRERRVDTVIFATGFESTSFLAPIQIEGRGGQSLEQHWKGGAEAYLGVAVAGFPNFFVLYGPNTNLGHNSIIFMVECQVRYVVQCLRRIVREGLRELDVRPDAMDRDSEEVQRKARQSVWSADCTSWYKTVDGRITNNWPDFTVRYWWRTLSPRWRDYRARA
jgi:cation diffusion facilitator CzcD-associated flavoprotein CzcO